MFSKIVSRFTALEARAFGCSLAPVAALEVELSAVPTSPSLVLVPIRKLSLPNNLM